MKEIVCNRKQKIIVDDYDYEFARLFSWTVDKKNAVTGWVDGRVQTLSRILTNCPPEKEVDHINRNRLDNRRLNLRVCTHAENMYNKAPCKNNKSGFKGVIKSSRGWLAIIKFPNTKKQFRIDFFPTDIAAAHAYDEYAKLAYGEFAYLNFPSKSGMEDDDD
jgi:hypothetical protein